MRTEYIVVFDDGRFLGMAGRPVREYPNAETFSSRRKAEQSATRVNLPSTVISTTEYAGGPANNWTP